jgi:hypothetical protein
MDVCDPLPMVLPDLDHRHGRFEALIEDSDGAIAEACYEDVPGYLIGSQRCDAGARARRYVLDSLVRST